MTLCIVGVVLCLYGLSAKVREVSPEQRFDIVEDEALPTIILPTDEEKSWHFDESISLLTGSESELVDNLIEKMRESSQVRRKKRQKMVGYLLENYNVLEDEAYLLVRSADSVARKNKIDLELLMAVIFVESTYNSKAKSNVGAIGLMQVVPKWHLDKISPYGGVEVLYDIPINIEIGTEILMEYFRKEGNLRSALHRYNGSLQDPSLKYSNRVIAKYNLLKRMMHYENAYRYQKFDIIRR